MKALSKFKWGFALIALAAVAFAAPAMAEGELLNQKHMWDELWHEIMIDLWVIGVVFGGAALIMLFAYKAKDPNAVGKGPNLSKAQAIGWVLIPCALFMADDFFLAAKGWTLWNVQRDFTGVTEAGATEIKVTGNQWYWTFTYDNEVETETMFYNTPDNCGEGETSCYDGEGLVVPVGKPVMLRMDSADVIHSFGVAHYRMTEDVMPGRITYLWFMPEESDIGQRIVITCREYCGANHSIMAGQIHVKSQADFDEWMTEQEAALEAEKTKKLADTVPSADPKA